jgi:hypothetical protein
MVQRRSAIIYLAAASAAVINVQPAAAKIACSNGFQIVQGSPLATPYCQDELVAQVARQYGVRASAAHIRNNPNFKRHVCRLVGQDIRIKGSCEEVNPTGRGRF